MQKRFPTGSPVRTFGVFLLGGAIGAFGVRVMMRMRPVPEPIGYAEEFEDSLLFLGDKANVNPENPDHLKELYKQFVNRRASYEWLEENGGLEDAELRYEIRQAAYVHLVRERVDAEVRIQDVSEADLESYYQENESAYDIPARFRGYYLAWDPDHPRAAPMRERIPDTADTGQWEAFLEEFDEVWSSEAPVGLIPSMYAREWREHVCPVPGAVADALTESEGDKVFVGPVETEEMSHGFYVIGRQDPVTIPLRDVRSHIRREVYRQRWDQRFEEVMADISPDPRPELRGETLARCVETLKQSRLARETDPIPDFRPDM